MIFGLISGFGLSAQENVFFREDFNDNQNKWLIQDNKDATTQIVDGVYRINHRNRKSGRVFHKDIYINPKQDFYIELKFTQLKGTKKHGSGLMWGMADIGNMYSFIITHDGYYRISMFKKRKYYNIKSWSPSKHIRSLGKPNVLAIAKKRFVLTFYINGNKVHEIEYPPLFGTKVGLDVNYNMLLEADHLIIKHPPVKINLLKQTLDSTTKENLGANVNSSHAEVAPVISPDGKTLYLVRDKHPENILPNKKNDIWRTQLMANNTWSKITNAGRPLSNEGHNQVISILPDGNTLLLNGFYGGAQNSRRGLYLTHRSTNGWQKPQPIRIKNYYNNAQFVSECISADARTLILSVERRYCDQKQIFAIIFLRF